uniref:Uncharacterized protein n=1 Tax=Cacopsylla melanoneura TaxID=428564 RepID=A0A8D9BIS3_9HEMI
MQCRTFSRVFCDFFFLFFQVPTFYYNIYLNGYLHEQNSTNVKKKKKKNIAGVVCAVQSKVPRSFQDYIYSICQWGHLFRLLKLMCLSTYLNFSFSDTSFPVLLISFYSSSF